MSALTDERNEGLRRIAGRLLRSRTSEGAPTECGTLWDAQFFGLTRVARFRDAGVRQQNATLARASEALLAESWCIERSGVVFCAKMTLLADNFEEQRLFALIGADEAIHSAWLEPWIAEHARGVDPFSRFIAGLVEEGNPQPLAFLLQVMLEGFGIVHYSGLADDCRDAVLASSFKRMAQDEALHHAAGLAAFRAERLSEADKHFLVDGAHAFLQMIRSGPQAIVMSLDRAIGVGDEADAARVFDNFGSEEATAHKLDRLRRLMMQPGMEWLIDTLEQRGMFIPCTAVESAQIYVSGR